MRIVTEATYRVEVFMSGPIDDAARVLRREVMRQGLCVTLTPTTYIYTGGEERGFVVGLVNYPRFPTTPDQLLDRARGIARLLVEELAQLSALLVAPDITEWHTSRPEAPCTTS